jgi:hypothetical protein
MSTYKCQIYFNQISVFQYSCYIDEVSFFHFLKFFGIGRKLKSMVKNHGYEQTIKHLTRQINKQNSYLPPQATVFESLQIPFCIAPF